MKLQPCHAIILKYRADIDCLYKDMRNYQDLHSKCFASRMRWMIAACIGWAMFLALAAATLMIHWLDN